MSFARSTHFCFCRIRGMQDAEYGLRDAGCTQVGIPKQPVSTYQTDSVHSYGCQSSDNLKVRVRKAHTKSMSCSVFTVVNYCPAL